MTNYDRCWCSAKVRANGLPCGDINASISRERAASMQAFICIQALELHWNYRHIERPMLAFDAREIHFSRHMRRARWWCDYCAYLAYRLFYKLHLSPPPQLAYALMLYIITLQMPAATRHLYRVLFIAWLTRAARRAIRFDFCLLAARHYGRRSLLWRYWYAIYIIAIAADIDGRNGCRAFTRCYYVVLA